MKLNRTTWNTFSVNRPVFGGVHLYQVRFDRDCWIDQVIETDGTMIASPQPVCDERGEECFAAAELLADERPKFDKPRGYLPGMRPDVQGVLFSV